MDKHLTLYELNNLVRRSIEMTMDDEYWVEAELSELHESRGHCYMELVEKDERNVTPVAKASAKCWKQTWMVVRPYFERATGQPLRPGMKVLLRVYPQFHEAYGFSWIVTDIDPTYTIGDMARRRKEIVDQLRAEGVLDLNKQIPMPMFAQRIAVVSSATAAGYGDFCAQLRDNEYGFSFTVQLFPAIMQGEQVEQSVIAALNAINARYDDFDCVVIIRGGGATSDMSGFDTLALAENVANFPMPVITGIGHDRDETVLDMVSHTRVKTPTAAAAFLVNNLKAIADSLDDASNRLVRTLTARMENEKLRIGHLSARIPVLFSMVKTRQDSRLQLLAGRLSSAVRQCVADERHHIEMMEQRANALDPQTLLKRGYSITLCNGRVVHDASALSVGDVVETRVEKGTFKSIVR